MDGFALNDTGTLMVEGSAETGVRPPLKMMPWAGWNPPSESISVPAIVTWTVAPDTEPFSRRTLPSAVEFDCSVVPAGFAKYTFWNRDVSGADIASVCAVAQLSVVVCVPLASKDEALTNCMNEPPTFRSEERRVGKE